jgi:hypothetical protein
VPSAAEQERLSKQVVDAQSDDLNVINKLAARAHSVGEKLAKDKDFASFSHNTVELQKDMDYSSIRALKHMRRILSTDELNNLPYPKSQATDVAQTNDPSNFDVYKTTRMNVIGESVPHTTSFYANIAETMPDGISALAALRHLDMAERDHKDTPDEYKNLGKVEIKSRRADHKKTLNTLLKAIRTAAHIHLQEQKIAMCADVHFEWYKDKKTGEIARSPRPIWIMSKKEGMASIKDWSVGQFLNWKITPRAIREGTLERIRAESKHVPKVSPVIGPTTAKEKFKQSSITDVTDALNGTLNWYRGKIPSDEQLNHKVLVGLLDNSDEGNATFYTLYKLLKVEYDNNDNRRARAEAFAKATAKV